MSAELLKVLLIEDDDGDAELVSEMIDQTKAMGAGGAAIDLARASRLKEGLEMLAGRDIVLLDLTLPDSRGIDTLKAVRKAAPDLPVVVLSGNSDERVALEAVRNGAQDYLEKGHLGLKALYRMLRFAMERTRTAAGSPRPPAPAPDKAAVLEEKLRHVEALFERAQHLGQTGFWDWDIRANRLTWSTELHRIFDVAKTDYDGTYEAVLSRAHPDDRDKLHFSIARAYESREPFELPLRVVRPDGTVRNVIFRGEAVVDAQGDVARMMGTVQDLTDLMDMAEALRRRNALLAALAASLSSSENDEPTAFEARI